LVEVDINYDASTLYPVKMGLAVEYAVKNKISLDGANIAGVICSGMNLDEGSFVEAVLDGAQLDNCSLIKTNFTKASMHASNLSESKTDGAIFEGADLSCAIGVKQQEE
jgi:uncharacterized protein YjbI with pentapeptide repeats